MAALIRALANAAPRPGMLWPLTAWVVTAPKERPDMPTRGRPRRGERANHRSKNRVGSSTGPATLGL